MVYLSSMQLPPDIQREQEEKKKVIGASKIDQERWRKNNVGETIEKLDELGSPDEKRGIAATQKAYREYEAQEFIKKSDRIAWLNEKAKHSRNRRLDYYHHVHTLVQYELSFLKLPIGYTVRSETTMNGVKFVLKDRWGDIHVGGFTPSGLGLYDEQACRTSVNAIDDLISKLESKPKNGIFLP